MDDGLSNENILDFDANVYAGLLYSAANDPTANADKALAAGEAADFITFTLLDKIDNNISTLSNLITRFKALDPITPANTAQLQAITNEFLGLRDDLHSDGQIEGYRTQWENILAR
jgi:hypothetical protein